MSIQKEASVPAPTAFHYCRDLLEVDDLIVCALIVNSEGQILGIDWKKDKVPWETQGRESMQQFEVIENKLGTWMQIILGLATETSALIGSFERATFVHKNFQLVMLRSSGEQLVGVMMTRSANTEHVVSKIREILG
jgi:hypothetical protein